MSEVFRYTVLAVCSGLLVILALGMPFSVRLSEAGRWTLGRRIFGRKPWCYRVFGRNDLKPDLAFESFEEAFGAWAAERGKWSPFIEALDARGQRAQMYLWQYRKVHRFIYEASDAVDRHRAATTLLRTGENRREAQVKNRMKSDSGNTLN